MNFHTGGGLSGITVFAMDHTVTWQDTWVPVEYIWFFFGD